MIGFQSLLIRHYEATTKRGKITKNSTAVEFLNAAQCEDIEACIQMDEHKGKYTPEVVQEKIDAIAVRINELTHNNIDFIGEYEKNTIHQETRED